MTYRFGALERALRRLDRSARSSCRRASRRPFIRSPVLMAFILYGLHIRQPDRRAFGRRRLWCIAESVGPLQMRGSAGVVDERDAKPLDPLG